MTVTIGRRELLAALGGAAAAWPSSVMQSRRLMSDIRLPPTRLGPPLVRFTARLACGREAGKSWGRPEQSTF